MSELRTNGVTDVIGSIKPKHSDCFYVAASLTTKLRVLAELCARLASVNHHDNK